MKNYMFIETICTFRICAHDLRIERGIRCEFVKGQKIPLEGNKNL